MTPQEMESRIVRYGDLRPCKTACTDRMPPYPELPIGYEMSLRWLAYTARVIMTHTAGVALGGACVPSSATLCWPRHTAMQTAEYHSIAKNAVKEIAFQHGHAATFLPKWHHDRVGSSSHVHQSLWTDGQPAFFDKADPLGMSDLMKNYMAGLLKYAPDYTCFMAPYINSYKRFMKGTFAPTRIIWSVDNRTAGFRLCGDGTKAVRVECRIPGSDMNPYLAIAGMLAAGIAGIEEGLELQPPTKGDVYQGDTGMIPGNLRAARNALHGSTMLRAAMGDDVVDHYVRAAEVEIEEFERVVTDWEIARGFERA